MLQGIHGISLIFKWIILLCIHVCEGAKSECVCALVDCLLNWKCWCSIFNAHECTIKTAAFFWQTNASTLTTLTPTTTVVDGHNEQMLQNVIFPRSLCVNRWAVQFLLHHCSRWVDVVIIIASTDVGGWGSGGSSASSSFCWENIMNSLILFSILFFCFSSQMVVKKRWCD